ncbi:isochorismatase family protein [Nocardiopsis suaedae]|uniref:Isochorismatase family protein n=1 Tax=Nocardiopsis suaedae TaxID=3018444 RepID=A0ABT4TI77_9ACTN|nr:isochorismatase family protein [Nocardiopsis suaedae]MDA2804066.1 isochorismatase family protein [Nocardiopsis suaedae]
MTTALVLIDAQRNMLHGPDAVPAAPRVGPALADLLARARAAGAAVVHVQNDGGPGEPDEPHTPGWELVHPPLPGEAVVRKTAPDAFAGTALADELARAHVRTAVLAGMQSQYCVAATARGALGQGLDTVLASGAHATYDEDASAHAISRAVEEDLAALGVRVLPADRLPLTPQTR